MHHSGGKAVNELISKETSPDKPVHQHIEGGNMPVSPNSNDDLELATQAVVPVRIPRDNGFGDFCFGRPLLADRISQVGRWPIDYDDIEYTFDYKYVADVAKPQQLWTKEEWAMHFGNNPVPEIDGHKRDCGKFNYFDLPWEVRQNILRYLLGPYLKFDTTTNMELVELKLKRWEVPNICKEAFEGGLKKYVDTVPEFFEDNDMEDQLPLEIDFRSVESWRFNLSEGEWAASKAWFSKVRKAYVHETKMHPARKQQYELSANVMKRITGCRGNIMNWGMVELLRILSNVSSTFRQDVGEVLWKNTAVQVRLDGVNDWEPQAFFRERPAIHKGIKSLRIHFNACAEGLDEMSEEFVKFCRYIAKCPDIQLSHLQIDIASWGGDLDEILGGHSYDHLEIVRDIKVTQSFEVICEYHSGPGTFDGYSAELEEEKPNLLPKVRDFLMPNTLRAIQEAAEVTDEQTEYVRNRLL